LKLFWCWQLAGLMKSSTFLLFYFRPTYTQKDLYNTVKQLANLHITKRVLNPRHSLRLVY
jgi:hypothetical protein